MDDALEGLRDWIRQVVRDELRAALAEHAKPDEFLTTRQAGDLAGVTTRTIRRWIDAGYLTAHHAGRELRVRRADLETFMRSGRTASRTTSNRELTDREIDAMAARDFR